jgi:hypothetical protein
MGRDWAESVLFHVNDCRCSLIACSDVHVRREVYEFDFFGEGYYVCSTADVPKICTMRVLANI